MKKVLAAILAGTMVFSLAACGQSATESSTAENSSAGSSTVESSAAESSSDIDSTSAVSQSEDDQSEDTEIVGGWTRTDSPEVTAEVKALLKKATAEITGVKYTPVAYLATQVVAGTNHKVLCQSEPVTDDPSYKTTYSILTIYEDLEGNAKIIETLFSDAEVETVTAEDGMVGGWAAVESPVVTAEAKAAFEKATEGETGVKYIPLALLATQLVSGTNYSLIHETQYPGSKAASDGPAYTLVHVYEDLEGNATITDSYEFSAANG